MPYGPSLTDPAAVEAERRAIEARLAQRFGPVSSIVPLAPDASTRAFFRLELAGGGTRVALVDAAGGRAALDRMCAARALLADIGVRVPRLDDRDDDIPALLFEDFGDVLLADALPGLPRARQLELYGEAGSIAREIASAGSARVDDSHALAFPRLQHERLRWELALFVTQDVAGRRDLRETRLFREFAQLADRIVSTITAPPPRLAHRDFHARNLMLLADGRLGVVDFQDTLFAPPYYDLASLANDPYVEPGSELARAAANAFTTGRDPLGDPLFGWVALQRVLKAIGTYAFQGRWRGKTRFFEYIAPAERLALRSLESIPQDARETARVLLRQLGFDSGAPHRT